MYQKRQSWRKQFQRNARQAIMKEARQKFHSHASSQQLTLEIKVILGNFLTSNSSLLQCFVWLQKLMYQVDKAIFAGVFERELKNINILSQPIEEGFPCVGDVLGTVLKFEGTIGHVHPLTFTYLLEGCVDMVLDGGLQEGKLEGCRCLMEELVRNNSSRQPVESSLRKLLKCQSAQAAYILPYLGILLENESVEELKHFTSLFHAFLDHLLLTDLSVLLEAPLRKPFLTVLKFSHLSKKYAHLLPLLFSHPDLPSLYLLCSLSYHTKWVTYSQVRAYLRDWLSVCSIHSSIMQDIIKIYTNLLMNEEYHDDDIQFEKTMCLIIEDIKFESMEEMMTNESLMLEVQYLVNLLMKCNRYEEKILAIAYQGLMNQKVDETIRRKIIFLYGCNSNLDIDQYFNDI